MFFDVIGRRKKKTKNCTHYLHAKTVSDTYLKKHPENSVVISRILHNTKMVNDKWGYKTDG